ncbi:hypothetical protein [Deinococcus soli (ex Cha et al. 2016)]|uniref:hypothetical protein n=1 Tax=Deinococcus soli (ex Cha et al. 2016) TaxID=1309411 RepID=UPI0016647B0B|nr:hypothetical protein [Deinococcus soli (ex Cha et al. 2016)]GGB70473.1 hypothetical protein GCM10008019_28330 [Deinococcus soli (ex Cha et al. 2016)]
MKHLITSTSTGAHALTQAEALLADGHWQAAAKLAFSVHTADGYNLAAKALVLGSTTPDADQTTLNLAEQAASAALKAAPNDPMSHFEMAQVMGRKVQAAGLFDKLALIQKIKGHLQTGLRLDPRHPQCHAALAVMHAEIISKGAVIALVLGANKDSALKHFEETVRADPLTVMYREEYGKALLDLGRRDAALRERGLHQLREALRLNARNVWERQSQDRVRGLLDRSAAA